MSPSKRHRVVIIEPSPAIGLGVRSLLETGGSDIGVVGTYCDLQTFDRVKHGVSFEIVLINPAVVDFHRRFNVREMFSDYPDTPLAAIVCGYVNPATLESFDGALDIYDNGETMTHKLKKIVREFHSREHENGWDSAGLSEREKEILVAVAKGMTNKAIADRYCISIHTVISHRKNITRKTGIKTVSGLTMYAIFNNLVTQEEL
jgi:DNA-binding CsgD family transcriptional regulator